MDLKAAADLVGSQAPEAAGRRTASSHAWRYRLEQEQQAALKAFRAVSGALDSSTQAGIPDRLGMSAVAPGPARLAAEPAGMHGPHSAGASAGRAGIVSLPLQAARADAGLAAPASAQVPATATAASTAVLSGHGMSRLSALQSHLAAAGGKWPWRNLHLAMEGEGVRAWLRDSGMLEDSRELADLLRQLQTALGKLGLRLLGFTLNGKPIALA